ncbi:thioredoxin [Marinibaculum pumilum]|uniref:Thioredoxin n=1 Tax=Marinibaculum pumilum TaxID=1766165 RepID=A0ABV7KVU1_9PROT
MEFASQTPDGQMAGGADLVKDSSMATFMQDVIEASREVPVLVDFWAPWCGPCKTLTPVLEKVVRAAGGKVKLVKVNIDEPQNQPLAQQLRIQSIPAVYAFQDGQPVDGFMGALPESQVKQFIERLAGGEMAGDPVEEALEQGREALEAGDLELAQQAFAAVLQQEPENAAAIGGLLRCMVAGDALDKAKEMLARVPAKLADDEEIKGARAAIELAERSQAAAGQVGELAAKVEANPKDHQARYDYALALLGAHRREEAVDQLLDIVRQDRKWNDEAARKQLVELFDTFGQTDPLTIETRRRLSSILFS